MDIPEPRRNRYVASKRTYAKKRPVCHEAKGIRAEPETIFRLVDGIT